jgi:hypothetical protein
MDIGLAMIYALAFPFGETTSISNETVPAACGSSGKAPRFADISTRRKKGLFCRIRTVWPATSSKLRDEESL